MILGGFPIPAEIASTVLSQILTYMYMITQDREEATTSAEEVVENSIPEQNPWDPLLQYVGPTVHNYYTRLLLTFMPLFFVSTVPWFIMYVPGI